MNKMAQTPKQVGAPNSPPAATAGPNAKSPGILNFLLGATPKQVDVPNPVSPAPVAPIDPKTRLTKEYLSFLLGGAAIGVAGAGLTSLLHEWVLDRRRSKELRKDNRTDENTIVLTLPRKVAELVSTPNSKPRKAPNAVSTSKVPRKAVSAGYYPSQSMKVAEPRPGTIINFGDKNAPSVPDIIGTNIASLAGIVGGWKLVDALYQARVRRELAKEEDQAQQEFVGVLGKHAEADGPMDRMFKSIGGLTGLAWLLGTGGVAWLTKALLDSKAKEQARAGLEIPRVRRVVFRTMPEQKPEEEQPAPAESAAVPGGTDSYEKLSADELGSVQAVFGTMLDRVDSESRVLNAPPVQVELTKLGMTNRGLFLMLGQVGDFAKAAGADEGVNALTDHDPLYQLFLKNAALRAAVLTSMYDIHPMLDPDAAIKFAQAAATGSYSPDADAVWGALNAHAPAQTRMYDMAAERMRSAAQLAQAGTGAIKDKGGLLGWFGNQANRVVENVTAGADYNELARKLPASAYRGQIDPLVATMAQKYKLQPGDIAKAIEVAGPEVTGSFMADQMQNPAGAASEPNGVAQMLLGLTNDSNRGQVLGRGLQAYHYGNKAWQAFKPYAPLALGGLATWMATRNRRPEDGRSMLNYLPLLAGAGMTGYNVAQNPRGVWPVQQVSDLWKRMQTAPAAPGMEKTQSVKEGQSPDRFKTAPKNPPVVASGSKIDEWIQSAKGTPTLINRPARRTEFITAPKKVIPGALRQPQEKVAFLPDTSGMISDIDTLRGLVTPGEPAEAAPAAEGGKPRLTQAQIQDILGQVRLEADDPAAQEYLQANRDKLTAALSDLAATGKL